MRRLTAMLGVVLAACSSTTRLDKDPKRDAGAGAAGMATGGADVTGGIGAGGDATGGLAEGGDATGGLAEGGDATGGLAEGGDATGGLAAGGDGSGGVATGGFAAGGDATGGLATGGDATGGLAIGGDSPGGTSGRGNAGAGGEGGADACAAPAIMVAVSAGDGTAELDWEPVPEAQSYEIWRATSPTGPFTALASTADTAYADGPALELGASYYYRVSLGDPPTCENGSAIVEVIPCAPPTADASIFGNTVTLTWNATGAASYTIRYGSDETSLTRSASTTATQYAIAGLPSNEPVYALVSSSNATCSGGDSAVVTATPTGCTAIPSTPDVTATVDSWQNVLTWAESTGGTGEVEYVLSCATTSGGPYTDLPDARSGYVHAGLTNDTSYYYVVRAVDSIGCASEISTEVEATPTLGACQALLCEDFESETANDWASSDWWLREMDSSTALRYGGQSPAAIALRDAPISAPPDQSIQARIYLDNSTSTVGTVGAGVVVRNSGAEWSYYALTLDGDQVLRLRQGNSVLSGEDCTATYDLPASPFGSWYTVKLSVTGTLLQGYLDDMDVPKLTCVRSSLSSGTPALLARRGDTRFYVDDVRITSP